MSPTTGELVPLAVRLRSTQLLRLGIALLIAVGALVAPRLLGADRGSLLVPTGAYLVAVGVVSLAGRWVAHRVALLGLALLVDGVYLCWVSFLTGGTYSPLRYLILLHAIGVTLLASYRTGLKLAFWDSLLLFAIYNAQEARVITGSIPTTGGGGTGRVVNASGAVIAGLPQSEFERLGLFVGALWLSVIGIASFSAFNERELRRSRLDLESLHELAMAVERSSDTREISATLVDAVCAGFSVPRALVVALGDVPGLVLAEHGLPEREGTRRLRELGAVVGRAQREGRSLLVARLGPRDTELSSMLPDARNLILVPMVAEGRTVAVLVVELGARVGHQVERRVLSAMERFAAYAALAIRNATLLEQVQRLAATDHLTAIANRRTFETSLERELARASRHGEPVSLVLLDIDHFKLLNDTHGHQAGDDTLRNVAAAIACACREFDTPARYGGEEFAIILPGCVPEEAAAAAERFRDIVGQSPTVVPVTVSAGVATFPDSARSADELIRAADEALYRSKNAGRDRVTVAPASLRRMPAS